MVNSFNASRFGGEWEGFTWNWYEKLWAAGEVWESLWITLKIAVSASLAAMVLSSIGFILTKRWGAEVPLVALTSWQLIGGGLVGELRVLLGPEALLV